MTEQTAKSILDSGASELDALIANARVVKGDKFATFLEIMVRSDAIVSVLNAFHAATKTSPPNVSLQISIMTMVGVTSVADILARAQNILGITDEQFDEAGALADTHRSMAVSIGAEARKASNDKTNGPTEEGE